MLLALILFYIAIVRPQEEDLSYWLSYDEEENSHMDLATPPSPLIVAESNADDQSFSAVYDSSNSVGDGGEIVKDSGNTIYTGGSQGALGGLVSASQKVNDWQYSVVWDLNDQDEDQDDDDEMKKPTNIPDVPVMFPSLVQPECQQTVNKCQCKSEWEFGGEFYGLQIYSGCANPDKDILSPWCVVEEVTCNPDTQLGTIMDENGGQSGKSFDRCLSSCPIGSGRTPVESACFRTVSDCTCQEVYNYQGRILNGCANPDGDELGSWCKVINGSCSLAVRGGILPGISSGEEKEEWDYCLEECGGPGKQHFGIQCKLVTP